MRRVAVVAAMAAAAVGTGAIAGPAAMAAAPAARTAPAPAPAPGGALPSGVARVVDGTGGKVAGAAVPDVAPGQVGAELARIKADGIGTVALFVWWMAPSRTSATLAPYVGTQSDASLTDEIHRAVRDGLKVTLTPLFYCQTCEGGWRGTVEPGDVGAFFARYARFIDHYARLAQQTGVTTFFAGSEMTSLERYTSHWQQVISGVRQVYSGTVGYEENWDVLGRARYLTDVDLIGVSAYFPLDDAPAPTLARLRADWTSSRAAATYGRNWSAALDRLAALTRKPIVFGEVGYMSGDYAAKQPFLNFRGQADWQLQSDLYQALLETFSARPWWAGVVWWEWFPSADTPVDNSRSPRGKTAETLLTRWYADGWRPVNPDRPLALSGPQVSAVSAGPAVATGPAGNGAGGAARQAAGLGTPPTPAAPSGGLDGRQKLGLVGLIGLLLVLGMACWVTLGRPPGPQPQEA